MARRWAITARAAGYLSVAAIVTSCVLSFIAMFGVWLPNHPLPAPRITAPSTHEAASTKPRRRSASRRSATSTARSTVGGDAHAGARSLAGRRSGSRDAEAKPPKQHEPTPPTRRRLTPAIGTRSAQFGKLKLTIGYYIDALTVTMFCMVTLIASCVHIYALGYMHDELHEPYVDHEVHLANGEHLHRKGRFYRFFQYLSLFSFSMLGLVIAGNVAMVFVFWELVGICSYFLIGFYIERKSASTAANKAFIVNRVGDFGMLIGMMALWSSLGTFAFGDVKNAKGEVVEQGIFSQLRTEENDYQLAPDAEHDRRGAAARHDDGRAGRGGRDVEAEPKATRRARPGTGCCSSPASASSAAASARAPSSRCTRGCPTRWKARRPSRRSCTRRRWSPRACTWSAGSTRRSRPRRCW